MKTIQKISRIFKKAFMFDIANNDKYIIWCNKLAEKNQFDMRSCHTPARAAAVICYKKNIDIVSVLYEIVHCDASIRMLSIPYATYNQDFEKLLNRIGRETYDLEITNSFYFTKDYYISSEFFVVFIRIMSLCGMSAKETADICSKEVISYILKLNKSKEYKNVFEKIKIVNNKFSLFLNVPEKTVDGKTPYIEK